MASVEATIDALNAFVPADDGKDVTRLYEMLEGFGSLAGRERAVAPIFGLLERFPDADLGSPGPLVHELEAIDGYQPFLRESLRRRPTATTVWMVNRILNAPLTEEDRRAWMNELSEPSRCAGIRSRRGSVFCPPAKRSNPCCLTARC
jgi:hypothetical protein